MLEDTPSLAGMAEALSRSTDYRVLRRLLPRQAIVPLEGQGTKTGIILDVETTGLSQQEDEIIELGMVKFDYYLDGRVAGLRDVFASFNEPSGPIPAEITALTSITDEMVAGHRIDEAAVDSFVRDAVIVIAITRTSTANSRSATGRFSRARHGAVRRPRSNGGSTVSKDRVSGTC